MNSGGLVTKKIKGPKLFQIFSSVIEGIKQKVLIIRFIDPVKISEQVSTEHFI